MTGSYSSGHRPRPEADHGPVGLPGGGARNVHQGLAADPPPGAQQDAPQPHSLCPGKISLDMWDLPKTVHVSYTKYETN